MRVRLPVTRFPVGSLTAFRALLWVLATGWVVYAGVMVLPAWQARGDTAAALADRERELASRVQISTSLPITRARLEEQRLAVTSKESALAKAADDTAIIRLVEQLAGSEVSVTTLLTGQRSALEPVPSSQSAQSGGSHPPAQPGQLGSTSLSTRTAHASAATDPAVQRVRAQPPYWQLGCRIEATGPWEPLHAFLGELEGKVPGLRLQAVQLQAASGADQWRLVVDGSLYMMTVDE